MARLTVYQTPYAVEVYQAPGGPGDEFAGALTLEGLTSQRPVAYVAEVLEDILTRLGHQVETRKDDAA